MGFGFLALPYRYLDAFVMKWERSYLDHMLLRARHRGIRIKCETIKEAASLRNALYWRRRATPCACIITQERTVIVITPHLGEGAFDA
jgi:hypothetical protein